MQYCTVTTTVLYCTALYCYAGAQCMHWSVPFAPSHYILLPLPQAKDAPPSMPVYVMDATGDVAVLSPQGGGSAPCPRGGHTVSALSRSTVAEGLLLGG